MSKLKPIRAGTKVRLNYASDTPAIHHPSNRNLGVGTVGGKWGKTSYTVNFPKRGQLVLDRRDMVVVHPPNRRYVHPKSPTFDKVWNFTRNLHGSGINGQWSIEETESSFRASNFYETMNDVGMYDGVAEFTIIFPKKETMGNFKVEFNGKEAQYQNQKYMLRDFLEDTIASVLDELGMR